MEHGRRAGPLALLVWLALQQAAVAQCPNMCSGHGECGAENVCQCEAGYDVAPDCSLRTCPYGVAWADKAYAVDEAHSSAECSNGGICDRTSGICTCFEGYTARSISSIKGTTYVGWFLSPKSCHGGQTQTMLAVVLT